MTSCAMRWSDQRAITCIFAESSNATVYHISSVLTFPRLELVHRVR